MRRVIHYAKRQRSWAGRAPICSCRSLQHGIEHGREVARRIVDDLQYLGGRGLPLQRFGKFSFTFGKFSFTLGKATPQIGYQRFGVG